MWETYIVHELAFPVGVMDFFGKVCRRLQSSSYVGRPLIGRAQARVPFNSQPDKKRVERGVKGFTRREKDVKGKAIRRFRIIKKEKVGEKMEKYRKPVRRAEGAWVRFSLLYKNLHKVFPPVLPIFFLLFKE